MRHLFGYGTSDFAMAPVGTSLVLVPGATGTVWDSAADGTQITDLTDVNSVAITSLTADGNAQVAFYGPDGVTSLYVDFGYGIRFLMVATDLGDEIASLTLNKLDLTGGTMQGPLALQADPTEATQAATKAYTDTQVSTGDASTLDSAKAYTDDLVDSLSAASVGALATTTRGAASGVASLDSDTKVPGAQIPDLTSTYLAFEDLWGNQWGPADQGLKTWTYDPSQASVYSAPLSGSIYLVRVKLRQAATISKIVMMTVAAGAGLTATQNFAGLYTATGTRVGVTADQASAWATANNTLSMLLTSSYSAAAGDYYIAFVANGTTRPGFVCSTTLGATKTPGNANLASGGYRYCIGATGQTSLPSSISIGSATPDANNYWAGLA